MRNGQLPGKDEEAEKERVVVPEETLRSRDMEQATGGKNEQNFLKIKQTRLIRLCFLLTVVLTRLCSLRGCSIELTFLKKLQYKFKKFNYCLVQ